MSKQDSPRIIRSDGWSYEGRWSSRRSGAPMFGIFLIVFGLLLVAGQFFTLAQAGAAAFFMAVGVVLIVIGFRDKSSFALYVGVFIAALALSDLLSAGSLIHGDGWGTLFVGIGFALAALLRSSPGHRIGGMLGLGLLLVLWGAIQVAQTSLSFPTTQLVGPVLLVLLGVWIVTRRYRSPV
jgi:hypothetical protein